MRRFCVRNCAIHIDNISDLRTRCANKRDRGDCPLVLLEQRLQPANGVIQFALFRRQSIKRRAKGITSLHFCKLLNKTHLLNRHALRRDLPVRSGEGIGKDLPNSPLSFGYRCRIAVGIERLN